MKSRVSGDFHVWFCERMKVKIPCSKQSVILLKVGKYHELNDKTAKFEETFG